METTKSHGFCLAGFLLFMFLGDLTEACSCSEISLQEACSTADFVMRIKFISFKSTSPSYTYSIQPTEVYKGSEKARSARFIYTAESQSQCGYVHRGPLQGDDYVISGTIKEDSFRVSKCGFAKPWSKITSEEKKILTKDGKGC